jgi:hypothetical protein
MRPEMLAGTLVYQFRSLLLIHLPLFLNNSELEISAYMVRFGSY